MRFFVPRTYTPKEAEDVREAVRAFLEMQGLRTDDRRIFKLSQGRGPDAKVLKVGGQHPDNREEILLIFKAADDARYYLCTPTRGVVAGQPLSASLAEGRILAVDFNIH
jgi:hypothetical protein